MMISKQKVGIIKISGYIRTDRKPNIDPASLIYIAKPTYLHNIKIDYVEGVINEELVECSHALVEIKKPQ